MADGRTAYDEQLPWLQAVDDEDEPSGVSARKMLLLLLIVLAGAAILSASLFWVGRRDAGVDGAPQLIQAQAGPYKIRPTDPGGLDVAGESETAFQTSAGEDHDAQLDIAKLDREAAKKATSTVPAKTPEASVEPKVEPAPVPQQTVGGASGSVIQLGAFKNSAQAERAWGALSARFPAVAAMNKMIVAFPGMRLRASGGSPTEAKQACQAVTAGGENCFVVR